MKRQWDIEALIEQFTVVPDELHLLGNKTGATRLGFAVLLKYFQYEGRFPVGRHDVPIAVVDYLAHQLKLEASLLGQYDWEGRTSKEHRTQIRTQLKFREATAADSEEMSAWLVQHVLASDQHPDHLKVKVLARFREVQIEPPTAERIERLIRSACATFEQTFFTQTFQQIPQATRERMDALLTRTLQASDDEDDMAALEEETSAPDQVTFSMLKTNPGPVGVETILTELAKLRVLHAWVLPPTLFAGVSPQVLSRYRERAATETLHELRRHPEATRSTLLAAFCWQRRPEIIDLLVDLLVILPHRIERKAEKRVVKELVEEVRRVSGKPRLLYQMAQAAIDHPDQTIREGIYAVVSEAQLRAIITEYQASASYHQQVSQRMQASYRHHYRRVMPTLLAALEIRSNNAVHRPVLDALALVKRYTQATGRYYPLTRTFLWMGWSHPVNESWCRKRTSMASCGSTGSAMSCTSSPPYASACAAGNCGCWERTSTETRMKTCLLTSPNGRNTTFSSCSTRWTPKPLSRACKRR